MSDERSPEKKLPAMHLHALGECECHGDFYYWKPATMKKLAALGLVAPTTNSAGLSGHRITPAGREYLRRIRGE